METSQRMNHFFESSLASGILVYIVDDNMPVCLKFNSLIKLKVLFDVLPNSLELNNFKTNLAESTSNLHEIDNCDTDNVKLVSSVNEHDFLENDVGEDDVQEKCPPLIVDNITDCSNFNSKRSKKNENIFYKLSDSKLSLKHSKADSPHSSQIDSSKVKLKKINIFKNIDGLVQDKDLKESCSVLGESNNKSEENVYNQKLRSSKRINRPSIGTSSIIKGTVSSLAKPKSANKVKIKKLLSEAKNHSINISEFTEEINQQAKERQRKLLIERTITCDYCMVDFKNQQSFYDHRRVEESIHTCGICGKVEPYEAHLIVHMQKHRRSKSSLINLNKSNTESLTHSGHAYLSDKKKTKKEKMKCNICGLIVSSMDSLKIHTFLHTGEYAYRCCVCQESFSSLSSRQHHMDIHISAQRFKCNPCGQRFASRADLAKHQLTHEIICALCGEIFPNKTSRTCHFRVAHPKDILKCSLCSNLFASVEDLEKHMAYHKKGKKEQCPVCGVVVIKLKDHMLMHSHIAQEKLYACDQCPMRYLRKSNLDRHMRTHTGEKPYSCNKCPKSFRSNGMLRKHLLTHTKERPYQCEVCGKQCSLRSNLNIHMRVHNNDRHFTCTLCSQTFNHKNSLHGHMKNKHAQEINLSEIKISMPVNLAHEAPTISTPRLVSEFDKNLTFNEKHFQGIDSVLGMSQSDLVKIDKFQDFRQMQSHLNFPVLAPENIPSNLYIDNERMNLNKYDLNQQTNHDHGY